MVKDGKEVEEIQKALHRAPDLQEYSAEDSPRMNDHKKAHNTIEEILAKTRMTAVTDALSGNPAKVPSFFPYC